MSTMSQQQQSPQVQQPTQQQGAQQQGPVPEAGAFGKGNAVEYQGAYGNGAVAGMAGVEGGKQEQASAAQSVEAEGEYREGECMGGDLAEKDPALASMVDAALARGRTAHEGASGWANSVPPEHGAYVNERVFGLAALLDYLHDATADAQASLEAGDDLGFGEAREALLVLGEKVETAASIVDACEQFYGASELQMTTHQLAEVHETLLDMARLHDAVDEYNASLQRADDARVALMDAGSDFVEAGLQAQLMNGAAALNTLRGLMQPAMGPQSSLGKLVGALGGGSLAARFDGALGTNPESAAIDAIDKASAAISLATLTATARGQVLPKGALVDLVAVLSLFKAMANTIKAMIEQGYAIAHMLDATTELVDALGACQELHLEIKNLSERELQALTCSVETLPEGLELAKGLADSAAAEIASLEARHGGTLYDPS
jgi:hypothetical protein